MSDTMREVQALVDAATPRQCRRHRWVEDVTLAGLAPQYRCKQCGAVRDEALRKRNRNNRQRGGAFERYVATQTGGRRTGPLLGRDDVIVDAFAAIQTKKDTRLSLNAARTYLADLARTYPSRVPLVVHAEPGKNRGAVVILLLSDWVALHGPSVVGEPPWRDNTDGDPY
jgi:hypothetical protein